MDTAVAVNDPASGVLVHARRAHVVLAGLDARLPFSQRGTGHRNAGSKLEVRAGTSLVRNACQRTMRSGCPSRYGAGAGVRSNQRSAAPIAFIDPAPSLQRTVERSARKSCGRGPLNCHQHT
jgi:hypothetical protein